MKFNPSTGSQDQLTDHSLCINNYDRVNSELWRLHCETDYMSNTGTQLYSDFPQVDPESVEVYTNRLQWKRSESGLDEL